MRKYPTIEEIFQIARNINEKKMKFDRSILKIVFEVEKNDLKKINEELFYRHNANSSNDSYVEADEINVTVENINFNFTSK